MEISLAPLVNSETKRNPSWTVVDTLTNMATNAKLVSLSDATNWRPRPILEYLSPSWTLFFHFKL